jgi:hypothetical protein
MLDVLGRMKGRFMAVSEMKLMYIGLECFVLPWPDANQDPAMSVLFSLTDSLQDGSRDTDIAKVNTLHLLPPLRRTYTPRFGS